LEYYINKEFNFSFYVTIIQYKLYTLIGA